MSTCNSLPNLPPSPLAQLKWYNPQKGKQGAPSLSKAWAYYEHITLARRFVAVGQEDAVQRAEPGEKEADTDLYDLLRTPESALNEWGIGCGVYFFTVRACAIILLLAGLINVPNIMYYSSEAYNGPGGQAGLWPFTLYGTAICTNREWVVCENCTASDYANEAFVADLKRFGTKDSLFFVQRTLCRGAELQQGMVNYASAVFLILSLAVLAMYQWKREIRFDEDKATSIDYSIKVSNPPPDAYDPCLWRDFFDQFATKQVTAVTVALGNEKLLRLLCCRRNFVEKLRLHLPENMDMNNDEEVKREIDAHIVERELMERGFLQSCWGCLVVRPLLRPLNSFLTVEVLRERIENITDQVKEAKKKKHPVSKVFLAFETEEGQRTAL